MESLWKLWKIGTEIIEDVQHVFQNEDLPKPGDMIQFQKVSCQHWGIYVGEDEVVHFDCSLMEGYEIRKEKIKDIKGVLTFAVWNKFDEKYPPLDPACVVKRARRMVNKVLRYNVLHANCEHFATLMRYDKALSDQAERFNFIVDQNFEKEIRSYLDEGDCGSGELLQRKTP